MYLALPHLKFNFHPFAARIHNTRKEAFFCLLNLTFFPKIKLIFWVKIGFRAEILKIPNEEWN
jgi:hypothetical protein